MQATACSFALFAATLISIDTDVRTLLDEFAIVKMIATTMVRDMIENHDANDLR